MKTNVQLQPTVFAIFGGSGDLTWRKLVPSPANVLFNPGHHWPLPTELTENIREK